MSEYMKKHLKNINNEDENLKFINTKLKKQKERIIKVINLVAAVFIIVFIGFLSPQIYAKVQANIKYNEYSRRDYVSGRGEIATAYEEKTNMEYVYQNDIGVKVDSIVLTDEMRVDKLPENSNEDTNVFYQFGYVIYDEKNNLLECTNRIENEFDYWYYDYLMCLYKELGIKFDENNYMSKILAKNSGQSIKEINDDEIVSQIELNSVKGFPNSKKIYIRIFNIGYSISKNNSDKLFISEHSNLEWNFEIEAPDKFLKRETINLILVDEIPKLKIEKFILTETGMLLNAKMKSVVNIMEDGMDGDENWGDIRDAMFNITDTEGNIYYPVAGGTIDLKDGFYKRFEIDKDLYNSTTLYLNMKIGDKEYMSEIIKED